MCTHFITGLVSPDTPFDGYLKLCKATRKGKKFKRRIWVRPHLAGNRTRNRPHRIEGRALSDLVLLPEILLSTILKNYQKVSLLLENSMFGKCHRDHCTTCGLQVLPFIFHSCWEAFYSLLWKELNSCSCLRRRFLKTVFKETMT